MASLQDANRLLALAFEENPKQPSPYYLGLALQEVINHLMLLERHHHHPIDGSMQYPFPPLKES